MMFASYEDYISTVKEGVDEMSAEEKQKRRPRGRAVPPNATWTIGSGTPQEREEQLKRLISNPRTPLRRIDEAYVELIRPMLVQKAWDFYQQEGRGVIVLDFGDTDLRSMKDSTVPTFYMSERKRQEDGQVWPKELGQAIHEYDPEQEMLVVAHHTVAPNLFRIKRLNSSA